METSTIFLVDDDEVYTAKLKHQLSEMNNVKIYEFAYVERAIANLNLSPDLIILDHMLSGVDGVDAIPLIKEKAPHTQIVMVTGKEDIKVFAKAMQNGADFFFKKDDLVLKNLSTVLASQGPKATEPTGFFKSLLERFKAKPVHTMKSVYIVEDDDLYSFAIRYRLEKSPGLNIRVFKGNDLIPALEELPDLIILDYQLEDTTGIELAGVIKEKSPDTKIIMLSGQQELDTAMKLVEMGIDKYVIKNQDWTRNLDSALNEYLI